MQLPLSKVYDAYIYLSYFIYIAVMIGVFKTVPEYITVLNSILKMSIATWLIYKFNPFQNVYVLTHLEKKLIFSAGIYIILTTGVGEYLEYYETTLTHKLQSSGIKKII